MKRIDFNNDLVLEICKKYHVKSLRIFGSVARGDDHGDSDIDLLVAFSKPASLLQLVALERELSVVLKRKVDLVTSNSVSPYLKSRIIRESRPVYAA